MYKQKKTKLVKGDGRILEETVGDELVEEQGQRNCKSGKEQGKL